jgi:hypothetical protein
VDVSGKRAHISNMPEGNSTAGLVSKNHLLQERKLWLKRRKTRTCDVVTDMNNQSQRAGHKVLNAKAGSIKNVILLKGVS